jgi:hypothetical protein
MRVQRLAQPHSSSVAPSQSSSTPVPHSSVPVQAAGPGTVQVAVQVPVPSDPHKVRQLVGAPGTQANVSSVSPSQSSSVPLQLSAGNVH